MTVVILPPPAKFKVEISRILGDPNEEKKAPTRAVTTTATIAEKGPSTTDVGITEPRSLMPPASPGFRPQSAAGYQPIQEGASPQLGEAATARSQRLPQQPGKRQRRQSKWTTEEDALIIALRGARMKWEDISNELPGRSVISCRLRYQNYLERRVEWDEDKKNKLARLYERFKREMWQKVAEEMATPWRTVEAMHWRLGEREMAQRAGVTPFTFASHPSASPPRTRRANLPPPRPPTRERANSNQLPSLAEFAAGIPAYAPQHQQSQNQHQHQHQHLSPQMQLHQYQQQPQPPLQLQQQQQHPSQHQNGCSPMLKPPLGSPIASISYEGTRRSTRTRNRR